MDGITDGMFTKSNTCTHTNDEKDPWWRVTLDTSCFIFHIDIANRFDSCCWERLTNFEIRVGKSPDFDFLYLT